MIFNLMMLKIKPKGKQRQATEVYSPSSEIPVEESVPTPSNDPQPSGEDSIKLNELMIFYTNLQQQVLDLEEAKDIAKLKKRVKKLEKRESNKVFIDVREKTSEKEVSTADPVTTAGEVVTVASVEDSAAPTTTTTVDVNDELTMAKTLIVIKAAKPKDMSSASSAVTYTSVYIDSEPGRVFWGADEELSDGGSPRVIMYRYDGLPMLLVAPPSPDFIPGPEEPHTPPAPQDEDDHEPMFIQPHDPDFMPEPIYPEYIPLEDEHILSTEEQALPPVVLPTAESPGYVTESDPKDDLEEYKDDEIEDGPVDYPIDGGDDGDEDDDDSSRDNANNEDEEEEEEH
nr:hypothetical protein [Tanacetum cinerariifolium]